MARIVKEYSVRRNEILDAAQRLVYSKGYEQMTIQDILDDLEISKGAFYHYFDSKESLLEELIDRMIDEALLIIQPIVQDPDLPAIEKFHKYIDTVSRWKTARKDFLLKLLEVWYTDDNAIVRQKVLSNGMQRIVPELTLIIRQGIQDGVFTTPNPEQIGEVVFYLMMGFSDTIAQIILSSTAARDDTPRLKSTIAVYTNALERILGTTPHALNLIDIEILEEWMAPALSDEISLPSSTTSK